MACSGEQRTFLVVLITIFSSNIPSATLTYSAGPQTAKTSRLLLPEFVNITHLALEFVLTCGSTHILCNPEAVPFEMPTNITDDCPPIRNCDTNCAMSRSCSPDVEYAFLNISCLSTVLYSPKKHYIHTHTYMMIASCNDLDSSASSEYVEFCQNMDEINEFSFFNETFRPVVSRVTGIVYRNKFCASCNADDTYLNPFKLEMKCDNFFNMNSFSSLQEMWGALNTFNCSVSYVPPFMTSHTVSKCYNSLLFAQRQCNTTGLWSEYDSQIEWACKNFNSYPYKGYSNAFCYICNPSLASTQDRTVIGTCNVTGEWDYRNPEVENACLHLPLTDRTFPFRNKFCQICNVNSTGYRTFGNFSVFIEEAFGGYLNNFYYGKFKRITDEVKADSMTTDMFEEPLTLNKILPSMKALQELGEFCGFANFCSNAYGPAPGLPNVCSFRCSPDKNCCDQLSSNYNLETLSVYDQCDSRKSHDFYTEMCENGSEDDIISVVTVMSSTTKRFHRNAYCARCSNDFGELNLAGFRVACPKPLEVSLFMSFSDLQNVILRYDCNLTMKYPQSDCGATATSISNCRNRTHWIEHNSKILDNCERQDFVNFNFESVCYNGSLYRNIFCLICNRDWVESTDGVISECNVTGNWVEHNNVLEEMCMGQPYYPGWYPFKNIYCASCNPSSITIEELQNSHRFTISSESYITICTGFSCMLSNAPYRILFSLTDLNFPSDEGKDSLADEFCAEGKTLVDGECRVVIEDTFHLGYNTTFGVRIINASQSHWLESDLLNISKNLFRQDALLKYVEILQINLNEIIEDKTNFALDNKTVPADECIENEWRVFIRCHDRKQNGN